MHIGHIWIIVGLAFLICEVFTPGFFIASIGIGAFFAALASFLGAGFTVQIAALTLGTALVFVFIRPLVCAVHSNNVTGGKTGTEALIGRSARVISPIRNAENTGRVKIGGEDWKALAADGSDIPEGATVIVERIEGVTVFVTECRED